MAKIDLSNVSHSYNPYDPNPVFALNPFSMTWENGNRYAILGPSGCGKTTMLNIVSGLVRPSAGRILFDDRDVTDLITEERAKNLDGLLDGITVALYMPKEKQAEREKWLESLFKYTRLDFTKGIHFTTHYSPWSNLNEHIEEQKNKPCTSYNHMLIIAYDGTVLHCCDDYVGHFGLGNVNTKSVKDIWQSEEHKKLVHDLRSSGGRLKYKYCSECPR